MVIMLDQSLAEISRPTATNAVSAHISESVEQRNKEIRLIAEMVGNMRKFLGVFFKHFLCSGSMNVVSQRCC